MPKVKSFAQMEKERAVPVTTTIPYSKWAEIKKSRTSWNSLILRGWAANSGFEGLTQRSRESEKAISNLERNVSRFQKIILEQGDNISKLQKENEKLKEASK